MTRRKWLLGLLVLALLLALAGVGLNAWVRYQLPRRLAEANDSPYAIAYKDVTISLPGRAVTARGITLGMKDKRRKDGISATVASIDLTGIKWWSLLFSERIEAESLVVTRPNIIMIRGAKPTKRPVRDEVVAPFSKIIRVSDIALRQGNFTMVTPDNAPMLLARNLWLTLDDVVITDQTLEEQVPFAFKGYDWRCDSLYYRAGPHYDLTAGHVHQTHHSLLIKELGYRPRIGKQAFRTLPAEKDRYDIRVAQLKADSLRWMFRSQRLYLDAREISLTRANANIFRSKLAPDDLTRKKLYGELLREMAPHVDVDRLTLVQSRIQYEEEKDASDGAGKVWFSDVYLTAHRITGGRGRKDLKTLQIDAQCRLMGTAPTKVKWSIDVANRSDAFSISGRILNFPAKALMSFSKPYMNATFTGELQSVYFNFNGDAQQMSGDFALRYDDLKVALYRKKDKKRKNKLVSALANLLVKNDSDDKLATTEVSVARIPEKSFFNLWWRGLQEGLKEIIL